jgi:aminopeptidase N
MACDASELTDLLHCRLEVEVIPSTTTITGSNTFTVMSKVNGLSTFTFRLRSQFTITSALVNGVTPIAVATATTTTRIAMLDRSYNSGEIFALTISYSGVPAPLGFGSIQFASQNGEPLVYTLSEPYYSYTWWPCKDGDDQADGDNSDKFTAEVAVTAPASMKSVSNGLLQGIDPLPGARLRYRWATHEQTATYLIFFSSTNYNQWSQIYTYPGGVMPVEFSIFPANDTPANRAAWERCLTMLATYRTVFGEYPFIAEKYGHLQLQLRRWPRAPDLYRSGGFGESLTAHELAHQWWGDNITCKTWHDIWLNEGFATYAEALWEERQPGPLVFPRFWPLWPHDDRATLPALSTAPTSPA